MVVDPFDILEVVVVAVFLAITVLIEVNATVTSTL
jgi:hypothetical protein